MILCTKQEAADILGVSTVTLWRLDKKERFSKFSIGGRTQYDASELAEYIESKRIGGKPRAVKVAVADSGELSPLIFNAK